MIFVIVQLIYSLSFAFEKIMSKECIFDGGTESCKRR